MPPRSKQSQRQAEWLNCSRCNYQFSSKDAELHEQNCSAEFPLHVMPNNLTVLTHCVLSSGVLVATLGVIEDKPPRESKDIGKSPAPKDDKKSELIRIRSEILTEKDNKVIFMNPATMSACGISILGPVVIDRLHILIAWPDTGLPLTTVAISSAAAKVLPLSSAQERIVVHALPGPHLAATEVHFSTKQMKVCMKETSFLPYCLSRLRESFLTTNMKVSITFLASQCELEVSKVVAENGHTLNSKDLEMICVEFERLNVDTNATLSDLKSQMATRFYQVVDGTKLVLVTDDATKTEQKPATKLVSLDSVGGVDGQKALLTKLVNLMLKRQNEELTNAYGVHIPRAVLLHGPSGTGKTLLAKALAHSLQLQLVQVTGSAFLSPYVGETEKQLQKLFESARQLAPSLMLIDEIDSLCTYRQNSQNDIERRVTAALCSQIDAILSEDCQVFIIGVSRKKDNISPMLTMATRLGVEQELPIPNSEQRSQILQCLLRDVKHNISAADVNTIASRAHGYVGADLAAVCREGFLHRIGRQATSGEDNLTIDDLLYGLKLVTPSAMKQLAIEKPNVRWEDIGGMNELKQRLEEAIVLPIRDPELFRRMGAKPPKGHLMYGPPGCSKTMIAKALATECDLNFIAVQSSSLMSKWVGESEKAVRELFRKARAAAPAIVFFDEFDAIAGKRGRDGGGLDVVDRVLSQLLTEIDGVIELKDVSILAATNRPDLIDPALKRPGRLGAEIYVGLPSNETRGEIFRVSFRQIPVAADVSIEDLVERTSGYTGAEVKAVADKAAWLSAVEAIRYVGPDVESNRKVTWRHFEAALAEVRPRTTPADLKFFEDYANRAVRR